MNHPIENEVFVPGSTLYSHGGYLVISSTSVNERNGRRCEPNANACRVSDVQIEGRAAVAAIWSANQIISVMPTRSFQREDLMKAAITLVTIICGTVLLLSPLLFGPHNISSDYYMWAQIAGFGVTIAGLVMAFVVIGQSGAAVVRSNPTAA